jgi:hypothetical protein
MLLSRPVNLRALLRLCRIPNVFTAVANALAGTLIVRRGAFELNDALLVGASGALYLGGMVLNDFFDRHVDASERPERPIPSGQVPAAVAALIGFSLLAAGVGLAAARGSPSFHVALGLAAAILLYDGVLKATPIGPLVMGSCRFLNVLLGMSVAWPSGFLWLVPSAMGLFTVLITVLSRDEVMGGGLARTRAVVSALLVWAIALLVGLVPFSREVARTDSMLPLVLGLIFALLLGVRGYRNFAALWHVASARTIGPAIGGGILLMPSIDATFVAAAGLPFSALAVLALTLPAVLLKRWYYLT